MVPLISFTISETMVRPVPCSRSKFLSKILKILVKNFPEIFPEFFFYSFANFNEKNSNISEVNQNLAQGQIEFDVDAAGKGFYRKRGADTWLPFNRNLVLMNGTASYAYSGVSGTYAALFELDNFDFTNYRQISIKNLSNFSYEVTCGTKVFSSDGTYDISDLMAAKLRVMYHGNVGNPPIQLRIELIP